MGSQARDADSVGALHELGRAVAEGIADHQCAHVVYVTCENLASTSLSHEDTFRSKGKEVCSGPRNQTGWPGPLIRLNHAKQHMSGDSAAAFLATCPLQRVEQTAKQ